MIIDDIKKAVGEMFEVDAMGKRFVVRSRFYSSCDETSCITLCVSPEEDGRLIITDMCETYDKLLASGIVIDNEQNSAKLDKILEYSLASFNNETKEFYTFAMSMEDLSFALTRLFQVVLVAGAFDIFVQ